MMDQNEPPGGRLMLSMLQGFIWFDEGLQSYLRTRGWPEITRSQSIVMANIALGVNRPTDIARALGVTRQMVHVTLNHMATKGVLALVDNPDDRRSKIVVLTPVGEKMKRDAQAAMALLMGALEERIGKKRRDKITDLYVDEWGAPLSFEKPVKRTAKRPTGRVEK